MIQGYDEWKLTQPEPDAKYICDQCGEGIYEGDSYLEFDGNIICEACLKSEFIKIA